MVKTPAQRAGLAIIGLILGVFLALKWLTNPAVVDDPQTAPGDRVAELQTTINPNSADENILSSVPGISTTVAKNIVQYREKAREDRPGEPAFKKLEDLEPVKGIGPATIQKIEPYLFFP